MIVSYLSCNLGDLLSLASTAYSAFRCLYRFTNFAMISEAKPWCKLNTDFVKLFIFLFWSAH